MRSPPRGGGAILAELVRLRPSQIGVDDGTRTHDGRDHNPGLYQLSYVHHRKPISARQLARPAGLEPATLGLEDRCSIQLSYGRTAHLPRRLRFAPDPAL